MTSAVITIFKTGMSAETCQLVVLHAFGHWSLYVSGEGGLEDLHSGLVLLLLVRPLHRCFCCPAFCILHP